MGKGERSQIRNCRWKKSESQRERNTKRLSHTGTHRGGPQEFRPLMARRIRKEEKEFEVSKTSQVLPSLTALGPSTQQAALRQPSLPPSSAWLTSDTVLHAWLFLPFPDRDSRAGVRFSRHSSPPPRTDTPLSTFHFVLAPSPEAAPNPCPQTGSWGLGLPYWVRGRGLN